MAHEDNAVDAKDASVVRILTLEEKAVSSNSLCREMGIFIIWLTGDVSHSWWFVSYVLTAEYDTDDDSQSISITITFRDIPKEGKFFSNLE